MLITTTLKDGTRFVIRSTIDKTILKEIWNFRFYDRELLIKEGAVVIDIGVHIGIFSLYAAKKAKLVYAFEPFKENFVLLQMNLKLNLAQQVQAFPVAISGKSGFRRLCIDRNNSGGHSFFISSDHDVQVQQMTLQQIFDHHKISHCDFLKIDAEGAEHEILFATPDAYLQRIDAISFEYHNNLVPSVSDLKDFLEKKGFTVILKKMWSHQGYLYASRT